MTELCGRPVDFTEQIVKNWNNMVGSGDLVYHLGDVGFYKKGEFSGLIRELPGHKILIRGNHDKFPLKWYMENGFMAVMDRAVVNVVYKKGIKKPMNRYFRLLLSHKPMTIGQSSFGGVDFNVHGHFHNNPAEHWERQLRRVVTPKHFLFSLEETGYKPVELSEAMKHGLLVSSWDRLKGEE
jgi:calcineurin-like phosphoesterase family protein